MANRRKKQNKNGVSLKEFVTVAFAEDMELARQYKKLLEENEIPAAIRNGEETSRDFKGVAVMVPEDFLDEAHVLIESQGSYDDFYENAFRDPDDDDFEDDFDVFGDSY